MTTIAEIVLIVDQKTREKKIEWREGGAQSFLASIDDFTVRIQYDLESRVVDYEFGLLNSNGTAIESYRPLNSSEDSKFLAELFQLARRQALKVDEALDTIKVKLLGI